MTKSDLDKANARIRELEAEHTPLREAQKLKEQETKELTAALKLKEEEIEELTIRYNNKVHDLKSSHLEKAELSAQLTMMSSSSDSLKLLLQEKESRIFNLEEKISRLTPARPVHLPTNS